MLNFMRRMTFAAAAARSALLAPAPCLTDGVGQTGSAQPGTVAYWLGEPCPGGVRLVHWNLNHVAARVG